MTRTQRHSFLREVVAQLYSSNVSTIVVGSLVAALLTVLLWGVHGGAAMAAWAAATEAVYLGRYLLTLAFFRSPQADSRTWLVRFRIGAALQGALWGVAAFVLFPAANAMADAAFLFAIAGLAGGAAIAFGIDTASVLWFEIPLAAPLVLRMFSFGTAEFAVMGVMVLLYMAYVSVVLPRTAITMRENLRLRLAAIRRAAEVRERNALLNGILDNEPECVKIIGLDGRLELMNQAGLAMLEVGSVEEANAAGLLNFIHPDHRRAFRHTVDEVCQGLSRQLEFQVIGKRGTVRWLETNATPLRNAAGDITGLLGVTRNVTARKQAELALQKSEQRYRMLSSGTFEGILLTARDRIVDLNDQFARMLGYTREELVGRVFYDLLTPDCRELVRTNVASGEERKGEVAMIHRDGSRVEIEAHGQSFEQEGEPMRLTAMRDITARKATERALHKSEQRYRMLSSGTFEGIVLTSQGRIVDLNDQLARMLGYAREAMLGRLLFDFLVPEDRELVRTNMASGQERTGEVAMMHRDGSRVYVEAHGQTYEQDGEPMRLSAIRDVTERKQAEAQVRESRQLLYSVVEHLPGMLFLKDADTLRFVLINGAGEKLLGHTREEMIGKSDYDFFPREQADFFTRSDRKVLEGAADGGRLDISEEAIDTPAGMRILHTQKIALTDDTGKPRYLLGISEDITERKQQERALRESEEKLRGLYELAPVGIALAEINGRFAEFNEAFRAICGYPAEELRALDYWALTPIKYQADEARQLESLHASGRYGPYEKEYIRKDGTTVPVRLNGVLVTGRDGKQYIWSIVEDITGSRAAEREVRIAATAFEAQEGLMITDEHTRILRVNKAFTDITGYTPEDVAGKNPSLLHSGRHDKAFFQTMWQQITTTGSWSGEVWNRRKDGQIYAEHLTITSVKDATGRVINYVGSLTDITQRKASEEEIQRLAFYDHLTGLPNRRLFMDRLKQSLAAAGRAHRVGALLFIDMDNFKNLNDTLGHDYGDLLLKQIAQRLSSAVREGDTVARLGGDEFVVLLDELAGSVADAVPLVETVGRKVQEVLGEPYDLNGTRYSSTPSIGVTLTTRGQPDAENFLKQADIAMYQAKRSGRNTMRFFDSEMQEAITRRAALEADLRGAMEGDQIRLYFQVQKTNFRKTVGAEVLMRWKHPVHGMIPPSEFIPLAEESGLILPLGQRVIDGVCAQLKRWEAAAHTRHLALAVNVSARQFHQPDFAEVVAQTVRRHRINPGRLKLELTESLVLENIEETVQTMNTLNELGVQIALDDFGTGYSSLQYLRRLPLDQLKIDKSFVRDLGDNAGALAIVQTIIAMADSMGLDIIAEGVETEQQFRILHRSGCTHFQGYLFGMPMPLEEFELALLSPAEPA